jgi:LemA protein
MKRGMVVLAVVVLALLAFGGCVAGNYNSLVGKKAEVENKWAQVDNQLQRRGDLIGNLVETVKGAAGQEQAVFGEIAHARAQMAGAHTPEQGISAAQGMDSAIGRLLVVIENYPQLRSMESFTQLMDEVAGTENRIAGRARALQRRGEGLQHRGAQLPDEPVRLDVRLQGVPDVPGARRFEGRAQGGLQRYQAGSRREEVTGSRAPGARQPGHTAQHDRANGAGPKPRAVRVCACAAQAQRAGSSASGKCSRSSGRVATPSQPAVVRQLSNVLRPASRSDS